MVPPPNPPFGVISDLDDTVIQTSAADLWKAAKITFLNNARTRLPFEGVAEFYQALHRGPGGHEAPDRCPLIYISSSAWNMYDLLADFLDTNGVPAGPLMLRDLGIDSEQFINAGHGHKLDKIRRLLDLYPRMRWVLVGDSGQHDPELYRDAVLGPGGGAERFLAVYIRDVTADEQRDDRVAAIASEVEAVGVPMRLVKDSAEAAEHARSLGLIGGDAVSEVKRDARADEGQQRL